MNNDLIIFEDEPTLWNDEPTVKKKNIEKPPKPKPKPKIIHKNKLGLTNDEQETVNVFLFGGLFLIILLSILIGYMQWYFKQ